VRGEDAAPAAVERKLQRHFRLLASARRDATCRYREYLDHAGPILTEPIRVENGHAVTPNGPGNGLAWNEAAVERALRA
jgi:L-alanine-DL-glutamate epimerase-like enolase superfamily enzyme